MKIAVVGSREGFTKDDIVNKLTLELEEIRDIEIISGGARGVDSWAEEFAIRNQINTTIFKPEWNKYGKGAGFIRNKLIVDRADRVIAFWDGKSKGTKHSIDYAKSKGKDVKIINIPNPKEKKMEDELVCYYCGKRWDYDRWMKDEHCSHCGEFLDNPANVIPISEFEPNTQNPTNKNKGGKNDK